MKARRRIMVGICLITLGCINCSGRPIKLICVNQCSNMANVDFSKGRTISSTAFGLQLFLFIPIAINSRHARAWHALLAQAGADYVTDVKIKEDWTWAYVGTVHSTTIEATAYPCKS